MAVAFSLTAGEMFAEKFAEDLYSDLASKLRKPQKEESTPKPVEPEPRTPLQLSFAVPQRNLNHTGREDILAQLRSALTSGEIGMWKLALTGLGGRGKSGLLLSMPTVIRNPTSSSGGCGSKSLPRWLPIMLVWLLSWI
jgi:hypothetical protein